MDKALYHVNIAYEASTCESYKRFCYFYLCKISRILNKEKKLKENSKEELMVTDSDLKIWNQNYFRIILLI